MYYTIYTHGCDRWTIGHRNGCSQFIWLSVVVLDFKNITEQNVVNSFHQEVLTDDHSRHREHFLITLSKQYIMRQSRLVIHNHPTGLFRKTKICHKTYEIIYKMFTHILGKQSTEQQYKCVPSLFKRVFIIHRRSVQ